MSFKRRHGNKLSDGFMKLQCEKGYWTGLPTKIMHEGAQELSFLPKKCWRLEFLGSDNTVGSMSLSLIAMRRFLLLGSKISLESCW